MTTKKSIQSPNAPGPVQGSPYSQAVLIDKKELFISGVLGINIDTGKLVEGGFENEMEQVMKNIEHILKAGNSCFDNLIKTTIFLADIGDFPKMNEIYKKYIKRNFPSRSAVQVAKLPLNAKVEIEAIAISGEVTCCKRTENSQ